jgi:hypothetical protein
MPKYHYVLVACARWEERDIVEWLEYHRSIGFEHVYLYSNDDDPTTLLHEIVPYVTGPNPFVTYRYWPNVGEQAAIYLHYLDTDAAETEWFAFLDVDEFFVFTGVNNVASFMAGYSFMADFVYFHWALYGNNGRITRQDELSVLLSLTKRQATIDRHTKMLCRSAVVDAGQVRRLYQEGRGSFWHFLENYELPGTRHIGVLRTDMAGYSAVFHEMAESLVLDVEISAEIVRAGYIAHYQIKSEADFLRRYARGGFSNIGYWKTLHDSKTAELLLKSYNEIYDPTLAEYWSRHVGEAARYRIAQDGDPHGIPNVALNKPTLQSSVYRQNDATKGAVAVVGKANDGSTHCIYGFHTEFEEMPWIIVDLLRSCLIVGMRLFNRADGPAVIARARGLVVEVSGDGQAWQTALARGAADADWQELSLTGLALEGRYVRFSLREKTYFHLREIEIYGTEVAAGR